jgi:hypothetical protein
MSQAAVPYRDETVVAEPAWGWALVFAGLPAIGAGLGWAAVAAAGWVADLPFAPFGFLFEWLDDAPQPGTAVAGAALGAVAGFVLALIGWEERLTVTVSREGVTLRRGRSSRTLTRSDVSGAFVDGKQVVLLDRAGGEAARESSDLSADALRAAFEQRGYRWHPDGDPHAAEYARWVPDLPGLPPAADALLRAREKALEKKDKSEIAALRAELAKHGVVLRDEGKRQFWRLARRPEGSPGQGSPG